MRVVSVTPYLPEKNAPYAGHQFYFNLLSYLVEQFDVQVVAPDVPKNREALASAQVPWSVTLAEPLRPRTPRIWHEMWIQYRGSPVPDLRNVDLGGADVVELQWSPAATLAPGVRRRCPSAFLAVWFHDRYSSTLAWGRSAGLSTERRVYDSVARVTTALQECYIAGACDLMAAFKSEDLAYVRLLRGLKRRPELLVSSPWLEPAVLRDNQTDRSVLFVAAFDRWENQQAARWLIDEVWPRVRGSAPEARLVLAGAGPPPWLLERRSESIDVTGRLESLSPLYMRAAVVVAPIFAGGGLKFKVAQAIVHGVPLVATAIAMEGFEGFPEGLIAGVSDEPASFAAAILSVLRDPSAYEAKAQRLQEWAISRYSFLASAQQVAECYSRGRQPRGYVAVDN